MAPRDDDKALLDAARERAEIVQRYIIGRDPSAAIDEWEDPAFEVYHTTDRYGFIHDSNLSKERDDAEKIAKELERTDKWKKMYKNWDKSFDGDHPSKGEKLRARVWKGIPDQWRGEIWKKLLHIEELKATHQDVYEKMLTRALTTSPDIRQIDLDVNRTYRNHIMFRERYGIKQKHLFHVLAAYSMYNTEVGYCQGMSQIAALLLMYMDEEEAFWCLSQLLTNKKHAMHGLFIPGFPKLMRFQSHFELVIKKFMPKIYKFMNANMIPPSLYAIKWFMQCFLDRTPFPLTLRLWDIYMLEGERILIPMAFTVFKVHKKKLLKMQMEQFVNFLQHELEKDFGLEDDAVVLELNAVVLDLRRARVELPPPPSDPLEEVPKTHFGSVTYPTEEELIKRQQSQIHINDEPTKENGVSRNNSSKVPKHLVSNDSFRSIYDNHPISENSDLPVPPVDYDLDRSYRRKPTVAARHRSESSSSNRLSAQSAASVRSDHLDTADTTPTSSQLPFVESATFRQQSSDSAVSAELDIAVLKLDLSEEEEEVIKPDLPPRNKITDSFFEAELEKTLDEPARSSRSASKSPDIETANSSSHMYVRSAGFRGRTLSPPGARNKTQTTDIQLSPTQTSEGLNSKPVIPKPSPRPSNIPLKSSANYGRPSADHGRASAGYERGDVEIPITHLPAGKVPRSNGSIPVPTRLNQSPVSPVNFSSGGTRLGSRKTPPSKSPRPFPVPRSNIPVMQSSSARSNTTPVSSGLHLVSPTKPAVSPQYTRPFAISPHYARPSPSSQPTSPQYGKQVFHTFGGRGRQNHRTPSPSVTSSATQGRRSVDNLASGADGIRSPPVSSLRSPRYISVTPRPQLPLSAGNRTFYVVADPSNSRQLPNKTPSRYDFNEDDKSTQKPVFL